MVINHNVSALNTFNNLTKNTKAAQDSLEKLSSGLRINKAADDAAGLAISEKMKAQVGGLDQASANAQDGISLIQTAEGSLSESQAILQRMNELASEAANGTYNSDQQTNLQDEADQLAQDLSRIAEQTDFNGSKILSSAGALISASGITLQIGADEGEQLTLSISDSISGGVDAVSLGVGSGTTPTTGSAISITGTDTITNIKDAIDTISTARAKLGAYQNRLDHTINNLTTESENLTSAESQITDVDMASEMTNYTKNNILVQSAEAMLSQSSKLPEGVLSMLQNL